MSIPKKIELVANLGIVAIAILLGSVLVSRYLRPPFQKSQAAEVAPITPGTKLSLPGVDWSKSSQTLLLVLSTTCRYCTESVPFYQRVAQKRSARNDVRLVALLPQPANEAEGYLRQQSIKVDEILQTTPDAAYARSTPTLIVVDRSGSVVQSWVGKLTAQKETEVFTRFLGSGN